MIEDIIVRAQSDPALLVSLSVEETAQKDGICPLSVEGDTATQQRLSESVVSPGAMWVSSTHPDSS